MYRILLLVLISKLNANVVVNPFGPTVSSEYAQCLIELINVNFDQPGLAFVADTYNSTTHVVRIREEVLKYLHEQLIYSVRTESPKIGVSEFDNNNNDQSDGIGKTKMENFTVIPLANYYVIIVNGFTEYKYIVDKIVTLRTWNPRAYFIILCLRIIDRELLHTQRYPERMMTYLFKHNAINVVIIIPDEKDYRNGIVYNWKPFDPPLYCGYHNETADNRVFVESTCLKGVLSNKRKVFGNRVPADETGCYIDIIAIERTPFISNDENDPNLEKILLEELASLVHLKTNYEIVRDFRGEKDVDGVWGGALTQIVNGKGDILVGGVFPDYDVHEDFDSSTPYLADSYTWIVPRARKSPPWISLIVIFHNFVWFSAGCTFVVCVLSWWIIAHFSDDTPYHKCIDHCLLNCWYVTLGFSSYMRPVRQSLRVFFVFLNLYCILFLTAYQTKLIDVLTHPSFQKQIKTIEELVKSDLKIGGSEELHDLFENSTDPLDYEIGEVWINVDNIETALLDVVVHRNFSMLISRLEMKYLSAIMPELSDDFGNPTYYEFEGSIFNVPLEIVTLRGFPLLDQFNYYLGIYRQCGVLERIRRMFKNLTEIRKANLLNNITKAKPTENPLSLLHLEGGFLALIVGYISGSTALIIEIIINTKYVSQKLEQLEKYLQKIREGNVRKKTK